MRAVTFTLGRPDGSHIAYRLFDADTGVERERVYHLNVLADETVVLLGRMRGDVEAAQRRLREDADVLGHSVTSEDGRSALVFVHARPPPELRAFLELPRTHEVFFDFPLASTEDGRLRVVMVAESNAALEGALADLPSALELTVERIGPYLAGGGPFLPDLTDRQREVLDAAIDIGYYEMPRRATQRELAERLGLSAGTVSEHLQKVEARVFGALPR